ncbi:MAG: DNA primase [Bacillota bacterium]
MRAGLDSAFLDQVRARSDIVDVLGEYLDLKKAGKNYAGLCPFHPDRRPSLSVSPERQMFYCFACGAGGDVFAFVMKREGLPFLEAVRLLARRAGIPWPERHLTPAEEARARHRRRLLDALALAADFFAARLQGIEGARARTYLGQRGIGEETVRRFGLGYAPASWDALVKFLGRQGFAEQELAESGLAVPRETGGVYDRFRHRLMFPIWDVHGQVIGFGGRALDDAEPKYLNSPESPVFQKGSTWYALHLARETIRREQQAVVVEGYMDVIAAHQAGFASVVASMGTAFTREQARSLQGYCPAVVICYDADAAGQSATWRSLEILRDLGMRVYVAALPEGHDPDSLIRREGREALARVLEQALPLVQFRIEAASRQATTVEGKLQAVANIIPVLADLSSPVEREEYVREAARRLGVSEDALWQELRAYGRQRRRHKGQGVRERIAEMNESGRSPALVKAEEMLVRLMLEDPGKVERVQVRISAEEFRHPVWRELATAAMEVAAGAVPPGTPAAGVAPAPEVFAAGLAAGLQSEQALSALARIQVESFSCADPDRALEDCLALLEGERSRRRLEELGAQIREYDERKEPVPAAILEEYQELVRAVPGRRRAGKEG